MPKTKKSESSSSSDSGPDDLNPAPAKKKSKDSDNDSDKVAPNTWTLEKLRRVRVNEFHGRKMVDIREYYEKDGEILPGRKGIALSLAQWLKLVELAPEISKSIKD